MKILTWDLSGKGDEEVRDKEYFSLIEINDKNIIVPYRHKEIRYKVFKKNCVFFTTHCNPSLADIAVRDLQSSQRNPSVQSLLLAGNFLYNQYQPSAGEGEVANFENSLKKTQYLMNTLYVRQSVRLASVKILSQFNLYKVYQKNNNRLSFIIGDQTFCSICKCSYWKCNITMNPHV